MRLTPVDLFPLGLFHLLAHVSFADTFQPFHKSPMQVGVDRKHLRDDVKQLVQVFCRRGIGSQAVSCCSRR